MVKKYIVLLFLFVIYSCAPVYLPNSRNAPMFKGAGEIQAGISVGNGVELHAAGAITDHIGVMANYYYVNREPSKDTEVGDIRKHKLFEGGIGYYKNFEHNMIEIFAGYGRGEGTSHGAVFPAFSEFGYGSYNKIFFQPTIGFNKKSTHVGLVQRISIIDFTEFNDGTTRLAINEKSQAFYEPAVIGKVNFADDHLYFCWQAGMSIPMFKDPYFEYRSFILSAGMGFRINAGPKPDSKKQLRDTR